MATEYQVKLALAKAAEALTNRTLAPTEVDDLYRRYNRADGTVREKSNEALRGFTGLSNEQIRIKVAASDNTDRVMTDMQNILDEWEQ